MNVMPRGYDDEEEEDADTLRERLTAWATMVGKTFHGDGLPLDAVTSLISQDNRSGDSAGSRRWTIAEHEHARADPRRKAWVSIVLLVGNRIDDIAAAHCRTMQQRTLQGTTPFLALAAVFFGSNTAAPSAPGTAHPRGVAPPPSLPSDIWIHIIKFLDVANCGPASWIDVHEIADAVAKGRMDPYKGLVAVESTTQLATMQLRQMQTCMKLEADRIRELACQLEVAATLQADAAASEKKTRAPADWSREEHDVCRCPTGAHGTVTQGQVWAVHEAEIKKTLIQQQEARQAEAEAVGWSNDPRGEISTIPTVYHFAVQLACLDDLVDACVAKLKDASVLKASTLASLKEFAKDAGATADLDVHKGYDEVTLALAVNHVLKTTPMNALACIWLRNKAVALQGFSSAEREQIRGILVDNFNVCDVWENAPYATVASMGRIPTPVEDPYDEDSGWWEKYEAHLEWLHTQFVCRQVRTYAQLMTAIAQTYRTDPNPQNGVSAGFVEFVITKQLGGSVMRALHVPGRKRDKDRLRAANFYLNHHCTFDPRGYMAVSSFNTGESDYDGCRTNIIDCDMAEDYFDFTEFLQLAAMGEGPDKLRELENFMADEFYAEGTGDITDGYTSVCATDIATMGAHETDTEDMDQWDGNHGTKPRPTRPKWSDPGQIEMLRNLNANNFREHVQDKLEEIVGNILRCPGKPFGEPSDMYNRSRNDLPADAFDKDMHFVATLQAHVASAHPELMKGGAEYSRVTARLRAHRGRKECRDVAALKDIREQQRLTGLVIPQLNFARLAREISRDFKSNLHFAPRAMEALQHVCEAYLVGLYQASMLEAIHGGRTVIAPKDLQLARRIRGELF